ncbi:Transposable element Tc3 transposase [Eumeta japonica]|uniref:Transposable element Tc3 transposase n=1 Tax=Eumeta variegata TaxID=151549 RepID=A0A4C1SAH2_EUMVA|nr:Transposable element Tc3 transposase [Eumeta japonica]
MESSSPEKQTCLPLHSGLEDNDFGNRVRLCRFSLHADVDDPDFLKSILWTDESKFTKEGILNLHNLHHWSSKDENPRVKRQRSFQRFSLNVWAGVIEDRIIGPHYLPDNLNGDNYLEFLQNVLPEMIAEVPIFNENRPIIFQNDGCPAHWRLIVREYLDNVFPNSWIGRDGPIPWPPRSPDLTPLDFYVWGRAK